MIFKLSNALVSFQSFINDTLVAFLERYVTAYLDHIFIYSDTLDKHRIHVIIILEALLKAGLYLKPEKCEFHKEEVKYLRLTIRRGEVKKDLDKVAAIQDWLLP